MLNPPERVISAQVPDRRLTQASRLGGASETEQTAVAVMPRRPAPVPVVMRVTAPGNSPMDCRNRSVEMVMSGGFLCKRGNDPSGQPTQGGVRRKALVMPDPDVVGRQFEGQRAATKPPRPCSRKKMECGKIAT